MEATIENSKPAGQYRIEHRRCKPGNEVQYGMLFNQFTTAQEQGDKDNEARLKALMHPLQESVGEETFDNLVTNAGRDFALDTLLRGSAYTAVCNLGLKGVGAAAAADTQASHASWLEQGLANAPVYTGNRKTITFAAAASQAITHTAVTFAFTSGGTVAGCFLNLAGSSTKDNTTGTLFSAGDFTGGNRTVVATDTLDVTYTLNG